MPLRIEMPFPVLIEIGCAVCDTCHSNGNRLEFWAAVHQLPIYKAATDLCRAAGRDIPWKEKVGNNVAKHPYPFALRCAP